MNVVHEDVEKLVDKELEAAKERFGLHHSQHEKICVIAEEFEESVEALDALKGKMLNAWAMVKSNTDSDMMDDAYGRIYEEAVHLACEAIQVACTARKGIENKE